MNKEYVRELRYRFYDTEESLTSILRSDGTLTRRRLWLILTAGRAYKDIPLTDPEHLFKASLLGPDCTYTKSLSKNKQREVRKAFYTGVALQRDEETLIEEIMHEHNIPRQYARWIVNQADEPWSAPQI